MKLKIILGGLIGTAIALMLGSTVTGGMALASPESESDFAEIIFLASIGIVGGMGGGAIASPLQEISEK